MKQLFTTASLAIVCCLSIAFSAARANAQTFQRFSEAEKQAYVKDKAHRVGAAIAGRSFDLSPEYLALIATRVEAYANRIGSKVQGIAGKEDLRLVLTRGAAYAPVFTKIFQARNVSPLVGVYLPLIESEYRNELVSLAGASGMFQFMEQTALRFGLTAEERNDPAKSADAAARYLSKLQERFADDLWLSLLAYNQGETAVERLLGAVSDARNAACSVCRLTEKREFLGKHFQGEGVDYTPSLIAAAIIGEHPQDFGVEMQPLSTFSGSK